MRIILPRPVIKAGSGVLNFALFAFPLRHFPGNRFVFCSAARAGHVFEYRDYLMLTDPFS
jgi:hypothetical protein